MADEKQRNETCMLFQITASEKMVKLEDEIKMINMEKEKCKEELTEIKQEYLKIEEKFDKLNSTVESIQDTMKEIGIKIKFAIKGATWFASATLLIMMIQKFGLFEVLTKLIGG